MSRIVPPFSGGGEMTFFLLNGFAVLIEGAIMAVVTKLRKQAIVSKQTVASQLAPPTTSQEVRVPRDSDAEEASDSSTGEGRKVIKRAGTPPTASPAVKGGKKGVEVKGEDLTRWYDRYIGLIWAVAVLLWSGEAFVEGWIKSGILAELSGLPH